MNEQRAPADLVIGICALLTGTGDENSLANVNTTILPNGAMRYVIADQALWTLDKDSTEPAATGFVLAPGSGPGRWFRAVTNDSKSWGATLLASGANTYTVDGNWGIAGTSNFTLLAAGPNTTPVWAITALGGILTYTGPRRQFFVSLIANVQVGNVGAARTVFGVVSHNNDITGVAAVGGGGAASDTTLATVSVDYALPVHRMITLTSGDTLRPKLAGPAAATSLSASGLTMVAVPC